MGVCHVCFLCLWGGYVILPWALWLGYTNGFQKIYRKHVVCLKYWAKLKLSHNSIFTQNFEYSHIHSLNVKTTCNPEINLTCSCSTRDLP